MARMMTPLLDGETALADKPANAQMDTAKPNALFDDISGAFGSANAARSGMEFAKTMMGGMWVGGRAYLTTQRILFEPNAMNRAIQSDIYAVALPLARIRRVEVRWGLLTSIIDFETDNGSLSIRCFGAKAFADLARRAAPHTTQSDEN